MTRRLHAFALLGASLAWMPIGFAQLLAAWLRPEHDPLRHTLASLGRVGAAQATAFNLIAFVLPGALLAGGTLALQRHWRDAGALARIALHALLIAALAFVAQGLWPFDPAEADAGSSRAHAVAFALSRVAWLAATLLALLAWRRLPDARTLAPWWLIGLLAQGAALTPAGAAAMVRLAPVGVVQGALLLLWFAWPALAALAAWRRERGALRSGRPRVGNMDEG